MISIGHSEKWDQIVSSFAQYDIYYLSGYAKICQIHGDGEPCLFFYESDKLRCINVAMKRDIATIQAFSDIFPANTYFDLMTPYGYGGFLFEGEITDKELLEFQKVYTHYMQEQHIVSEFVRYHPILNNSLIARTVFPVIDKGKTAYMDITSPEVIWDNIKSNCRSNIRKAQKSEVIVEHTNDPALFNDFMAMYSEVMQKNNASDYYYFKEEYYAAIHKNLANQYKLFYALYKGKIAAMSLFIYANQQLHCHLACSDAQYKLLSLPGLLLYEAACWGNQNGLKTLHLGGGVGYKEDSLLRFKMSFNKNTNSIGTIGTNIYISEIYETLTCKRHGVPHTSLLSEETFFPLYRMPPIQI